MGQYVAFPLPDGAFFQLRHLPIDVVEELEKKHSVPWIMVLDAPQMNGGVLRDLAREVAIANGLDAPRIDTAADLIAVSDSLVVVDDEGRRIAAPDSLAPSVDVAGAISWSSS